MAVNESIANLTTTGGTWNTLVAGEASRKKAILNLTVSNLGLGDAIISVRVVNGTTTTVIVPPVAFPDKSPAARVRVSAIDLTSASQRVEVMSEGSVGWLASVQTLELL